MYAYRYSYGHKCLYAQPTSLPDGNPGGPPGVEKYLPPPENAVYEDYHTNQSPHGDYHEDHAGPQNNAPRNFSTANKRGYSDDRHWDRYDNTQYEKIPDANSVATDSDAWSRVTPTWPVDLPHSDRNMRRETHREFSSEVSLWGVDDVCRWVRSLGRAFQEYVHCFNDNGIDGEDNVTRGKFLCYMFKRSALSGLVTPVYTTSFIPCKYEFMIKYT